MKTLKGPGIFLAQYINHQAPFNSLSSIAEWAANLGFAAVQIPCSSDPSIFDLGRAAESQSYCDEIRGVLAAVGLEISELTTHMEGQLIAVHPSYNRLCDAFAPAELHGNETARRAWAHNQLLLAAKASSNLGLKAHATFSGALAWPFFYPWPQRPQGLIEEAFAELATRWLPILSAFDEAGVDLCFELHPGEDLHDGATFERFLDATGQHTRARILYDPSHFVLQQLDYLQFIDNYHALIRAFHVKDAEFRPNGRSGVYGGYQNWMERPGRFRSLGDGQVDFGAIFSKLAQYDYSGWAVLEWEDCIQNAEDGARLGAAFIHQHILKISDHAFDDFAAVKADASFNRSVLGI
jgi:sugar phosphate isomerase/epimerase